MQTRYSLPWKRMKGSPSFPLRHVICAQTMSDFFRLEPDDVRIDLVAAWPKKEPSVVLEARSSSCSMRRLPAIRQKTTLRP